MEYLNSSEETKAFKVLSNICNVEMFTYDTYSGLKSKDDKDYLCQYLCYRYNDYLGNLNTEQELNLLLGINVPEKDDSIGQIVSVLKRLSIDYCLFLRTSDPQQKKQLLDSVKLKMKKYDSSKWILYLYANMANDIKQFDNSIPIYYDLLEKDYYSFKILQKLIEYYKEGVNLDSASYFLNRGLLEFPTKCFLEGLSLQISDTAFTKNCLNCLKGSGQRDSIVAGVYLTRFFLFKREFSKIDSMYSAFEKNNKFFTLDSLKDWESGEYYDIMLSSFFIQKKYDSFYNFVIQNIDINSKIEVEDSKDMYELIKSYFIEYPPESVSLGFEEFIKKHFSRLLELSNDDGHI